MTQVTEVPLCTECRWPLIRDGDGRLCCAHRVCGEYGRPLEPDPDQNAREAA
jgi:hypothetical protein